MTVTGDPLCALMDCYHGPDSPEWQDRETVPVPVFTSDELVAVLGKYAAAEPRVLWARVSDRLELAIAIGGPLATVCVYWDRRPPPTQNQTWHPVAELRYADAEAEFMNDGLAQPFPAETLIPPEEAIGIVVHLVKHHTLPATHRWVDPQRVAYNPEGDNQWRPAGAADDIPF